MLGSGPPGGFLLGGGGSGGSGGSGTLRRIDLPTFVFVNPRSTATTLAPHTTAASIDPQATEVVING